MHVFIDESGPFAIPKTVSGPAVSCCAALTLPTAQLDSILSGFQTLTREWPKEKGEIKGRLLSEEHFDAALSFYKDHNLLLDAVMIDLGKHESQTLFEHKQGTATNIEKNIPFMKHESMKKDLRIPGQILRSISLPAYVQSMIMTELIDNTLRTNFRWIPLADPPNMASFSWIIDGKDIAPTKMERLWSVLFLPWLEARSLNEPLITITEGDYGHLAPGIFSARPESPAHLAPHIKAPVRPFQTIDIKAIFTDRRFANSADYVGLQMVDVATSAVRRALTGTLERSGWQHLGSLLVRPASNEREVISVVQLGDKIRRWKNEPFYEQVLKTLRKEVRPIVPPSGPVPGH